MVHPYDICASGPSAGGPRTNPMRNFIRPGIGLIAALLSCLSAPSLFGQGTINVLTRNYNNQRTGANLNEHFLTTANVNSSHFGKLFMLSVDDQMYAGILYVSSLSVGGATHNVIFAATANNSVYAYDADRPGAPLWMKNFNGTGRPTKNTEVGSACGSYQDFIGNIGIVSTPVIDGTSRTIYFVTRTVETSGTVQRLHAVDITSGDEKPGSPQVIQASVPGNADGGSMVSFNPLTQNQRSALSLSGGLIYIVWSSFCDTNPYHGWVMAYDETTLAQIGAFAATPNGSQAGIWMGGAAPAFDASENLYIPTGNGTFDGTTNFGETMLKLTPGSLSVADYFTPSNYNTLNAEDDDFGSSGPSMVPGTSLLVSGDKEGKIFLLDTNNLGKEVAGDVQIPQFFQAVDTTIRPTDSHHIHNASPWWNSPEGLNLYVWGEDDYLRAFRFDPTLQQLQTPSFATGSILPPVGMPGGMMVLSANGSQTGTGIVWAAASRNGDANHNTVPGNLYAFNAETLALLWSSTGTGDDLLNFSKGSAPVAVHGKVYVGTLSRFVEVYGLKNNTPVVQDLAYLKTATGTASCTSSQTPDKAVNGSFSGGTSDSWCSSVSNANLTVDLGGNYTVKRFVVEHAGAGGESFSLNTAAFNIQVSTDGANFTTVVSVTGNVASITTNDFKGATARYVRLNITKPSQNGDPSARIYEFQVFGAAAS